MGFYVIISSGSSKELLQSEALSIFNICCSHGISIEMKWISRSQNEQADFLSRIFVLIRTTGAFLYFRFTVLTYFGVFILWIVSQIMWMPNSLVSIQDFRFQVLRALVFLLWIGTGKIIMYVRLSVLFCVPYIICVTVKLQVLSLFHWGIPPHFGPWLSRWRTFWIFYCRLDGTSHIHRSLHFRQLYIACLETKTWTSGWLL